MQPGGRGELLVRGLLEESSLNAVIHLFYQDHSLCQLCAGQGSPVTDKIVKIPSQIRNGK